MVLGADVLDIQPLWERMYQVGRNIYDRRGLAIHAISGIDMALHDAAAKMLGVPLCRLLGGCHRESARLRQP